MIDKKIYKVLLLILDCEMTSVFENKRKHSKLTNNRDRNQIANIAGCENTFTFWMSFRVIYIVVM
jgi:hypothetical protein